MTPPRDRSASRAWHTRYVIDHESYVSAYLEDAQSGEPDDMSSLPSELASGLLCRYSRGDTVEELREYFLRSYLPVLQQAHELDRLNRGRPPVTLDRKECNSWMLLFALVCFDDDGSKIWQPDDWFSRASETLLHAMVLKGFVPDHAYGPRYDTRRETIAHEKRVAGILLAPRDTWSGALEAYLREWPRLMKDHGYRNQPDDRTYPFNQFPLHVGIAVCAYDIDDAAFRHLPWYPRELVDYYRAHVRHSRDAWRTAPIDPGAGLPEGARPRPRTPALSRADAYTRWVELVSGSAGQCAQARKALGRRKTMPGLFVVIEALAGLGFAIQADIKDDATLEAQLLALCAARQLPPPVLPAEPPQGPARIRALLAALQTHAAQHGHQMEVLDDGGDAWHVVLVAEASGAEFANLCEQLEVDQMHESDWA